MLAFIFFLPLFALAGLVTGQPTEDSDEDQLPQADDSLDTDGLLNNDIINAPDTVSADDNLIRVATNQRFWGSDDGEEITGHEGNDIIGGMGGNDFIDAGRGEDLVYGGNGNDVINGGADDDRLLGGDGDDQIFGGLGNDMLYGGRGTDTLFGDLGDDVLSGDADDLLYGEDGSDVLRFNEGGTGGVAYGGSGDDVLFSGGGGVILSGGAGSDIFWSSSQDDPISANGDLNDVIVSDYDPNEDILVLQLTNGPDDNPAHLEQITPDMFSFTVTNVTTELGTAARVDLYFNDGGLDLSSVTKGGSLTLVGIDASEVNTDEIYVVIRDENAALEAQVTAPIIRAAHA